MHKTEANRLVHFSRTCRRRPSDLHYALHESPSTTAVCSPLRSLANISPSPPNSCAATSESCVDPCDHGTESAIYRPFFVDLLASVLTSSQFLPHELNEAVLPNAFAESSAALADPSTHALELAHALAFRSSGLGSSLFASHPPPKTLEVVKSFAASAFTKGNVAVIGTGVDPTKLSQLVEKHFAGLPSGSATSAGGATQYFGGETRVESNGGGQAVFVGFGAPGYSPELAALHAHLNTTPSLKWTQGTSPLAGTGATAVYIPYSDAALFGILVNGATAPEVGQSVKNAVAALKKVASGLNGEDAKKAVAKAKFAAASALEAREGVVAAVAPEVGPKD